MAALPAGAGESIELARRFAALSGAFDPKALVDVLDAPSPEVVLAVTSDLASDCDTGADGGGWIMRNSARRREIDGWVADGRLSESIAWRRSLPSDVATVDLLDALDGSGAYSDAAIRRAIDAADRETLNRFASALDRAGRSAPAHATLDAVRSAIGRLDSRERSTAMLDRGFFGRVDDLAAVAEWLGRPFSRRPVQALFISGLPGIGKSSLVDEAVRRAATSTPPWIVVRLDFDRGGLDVQDRVGLTLEISRQVSIELGESAATLRHARLIAAGATPTSSPDVKGWGRERVPEELSGVLGVAIESSRRPILMILDTLEVLRERGETHPTRLFETLDELCDRGLRPLGVISAGRGDALDSAPDRIGRRIDLEGLDAEAADALLTSLEVPSHVAIQIIELADGNPLVLRLAALAVREAGQEALSNAQGRRELAAAYLYRFLLSRITDPLLAQLAQPGLLVRRINSELIEQVLVPELRLGPLAPGQAVGLFDKLATHHWLVEPDAIPGWVRHRADIRSMLLRQLYEGESVTTAARINTAAAKWFAGRTEPFAATEAAYHQLQAMRRGGRAPDIDPDLLGQLDSATIAELPQQAQNLIFAARGQRTSKFRIDSDGSSASAATAAEAARELVPLLERGDLAEANHVYARAFEHVELDPWSPEAGIARAFLWRSGRWVEATEHLRRQGFFERRQSTFGFDQSPLVTLTHLEIWAEFRFEQLVLEFERDPALAEFASDLRTRGFPGSLANGALGFALPRAAEYRSKSNWSLEDPVFGATTVWSAETRWSTDGVADPRVLDALAMPSSRFSSLISLPSAARAEDRDWVTPRPPDPAKPAGAARLLASSTPYGPVADALRSFDRGRIQSHLSGVDFELAERGGLPPSGAGDWSVAPAVSPDGSIANVTSLGLLAEWLGAAASLLREPDLRLVAHAAERWRRTTAGDWAYSGTRNPSGTSWARRPDATIADRIGKLLGAPEPVAACRDELAMWWGSDRPAGPGPVARLATRFPAAVRDAASAMGGDDPMGDASSAAAALQRTTLPSAFVPSLAVLIALDRIEKPEESRHTRRDHHE